MKAALAAFPDLRFLQTALPLIEQEAVDALEWTVDTLAFDAAPEWATDLLAAFEAEDRLYGHGVSLSLLSVAARDHHRAWLKGLAEDTARRSYRHVTEHFGFMVAEGWSKGAPLPVPFSEALLRFGVDRMKELREAARAPVGLENLALAFGRDDVARQGEFLERLLAPVDGVLLLDLHNLHCQMVNFGLDAAATLRLYPLARVRELHVSGGSFVEGIRRDTHDERVPEGVWELLSEALPRCPQAEVVVLEQLPEALGTEAEQEGYRADFLRLKALLEAR